MLYESREEVVEIFHFKNISYVGATRNTIIFEMQEGAVQCERCPNRISKANQ